MALTAGSKDVWAGAVEADDPEVVMLELQALLLHALRQYWLPRHLIHVIRTCPKVRPCCQRIWTPCLLKVPSLDF